MTNSNNHKADSPASFLWASTGKSVQIVMATQQTLSELLTTFQNGQKNKTGLYADVAERLSKIAGKSPAWKEDYVQAVAAGTKTPSEKMARAIEVLAAAVDGIPAVIADTQAVTVYARPGTIAPGALLIGESFTCDYPPCTIVEVRTHPRQIYCHVHKDPKTRR